MTKRILSVVLMSLFAVGYSVHAKQINVGDQRMSNIGAIFTRDTSNPALGEAYKDPSGLIWGSIVKSEDWNAIKGRSAINQYDVDTYCKANGARLPTEKEFELLAAYLGKYSEQGYSPFLADGKTDLLPGLSSYWFWSSSLNQNGPDIALLFNGSDGYMVNGVDRSITFIYGAGRCVADR